MTADVTRIVKIMPPSLRATVVEKSRKSRGSTDFAIAVLENRNTPAELSTYALSPA
jgi:hypothetical protein